MSRLGGALAVLALVLGGVPAPVPAQTDDAAPRLALPPLPDAVAEEFLAVGRINKAGFREIGGCTGTLIRPDVVLTAAHCAGPGAGQTHVFVVGWRRGAYHSFARIAETLQHPAYGIGGSHDPRFDLGLVFLDAPLADVPLIGLSEATPEEVALVGYHNLVPHLMSGDLTCARLSQTDKIAVYDCPVVSGNSGGPVLTRTDAGWKLVGVVSSQFRGQGRLGAIAVRDLTWVRESLEARAPG